MIKPKKRKRKLGFVVTCSTLMVVVVLVLSVHITQVTVTGNSRYTSEEVTDLLFSEKWAKNTMYCYLKNQFKEHEKIPFVEDYKIAFKSLSQAEVIIYEKSIVGYVSYMDSYMYFDKDGIIVESTNKELDGIPWITGLKFGHIVLYKPLPVEDTKVFEEILNLTQVLSNYDVKVDKIQYNRHGEATLYLNELEVALGDSSHIDGKISTLHDMLRDTNLSNRSGVLSLNTYDETNDGLSYSLDKK